MQIQGNVESRAMSGGLLIDRAPSLWATKKDGVVLDGSGKVILKLGFQAFVTKG